MKIFNKLRKKRISNKINKLNKEIENLQGENYGVIQPAWDEGGSEIVDKTKKIFKLQDKYNKLNKKYYGGAVGPNNVL
tara:strand:- start:273 stop:506 length:234 start_codon:yes stop_codon:yes gene_type:complete